MLHTSRTLLSNIIPYAERLGLGHEDIIFMASPMAHQTGFLYGMLMPIYLGAAAVLQDVWDARTAIRITAAERPTFTMASTPFLADLIELAPEQRRCAVEPAYFCLGRRAHSGKPGGKGGQQHQRENHLGLGHDRNRRRPP